jgi:hypothetical protein
MSCLRIEQNCQPAVNDRHNSFFRVDKLAVAENGLKVLERSNAQVVSANIFQTHDKVPAWDEPGPSERFHNICMRCLAQTIDPTCTSENKPRQPCELVTVLESISYQLSALADHITHDWNLTPRSMASPFAMCSG